MKLQELRREIDKLDVQLITLLNKRVQLSLQIWREKMQSNLPIHDQQREQRVIENVIKQNNGPLTPEQVKSIFQNIIDSCRTTQQNQKGK